MVSKLLVDAVGWPVVRHSRGIQTLRPEAPVFTLVEAKRRRDGGGLPLILCMFLICLLQVLPRCTVDMHMHVPLDFIAHMTPYLGGGIPSLHRFMHAVFSNARPRIRKDERGGR